MRKIAREKRCHGQNHRNHEKRPREALSRTKITEITKNVREKRCHGQKSRKSEKTSERGALEDKNHENRKKTPHEQKQKNIERNTLSMKSPKIYDINYLLPEPWIGPLLQ